MSDKPGPTGKPTVGGQAVIEGVMMRSPRSFAVACRLPTGAIVVREERWRSIFERLRFLRWPFLRGSVVLVESLVNGMSALTFAARQQEQAEPAPAAEQPAPAPAAAGTASSGDKMRLTGVVILSVIFAVLVFKALPHLLTWLLGLSTRSLAFHLVDGGLKVLILIGYVGAIGLLKDIRRVYMYHGAEHKSIWAFERGLPLEVEQARAQSRFHPRCGTSFLLVVILVSVLLFAALLRYPLSDIALVDNLLKIVIKVPLMLPVAGLSYEAVKLSGKHRDNPLVRLLVAPGMWLQRLTTREPTDDQLEIALVALQKTLWREAAGAGLEGEEGVVTYASYAEATRELRGAGAEAA